VRRNSVPLRANGGPVRRGLTSLALIVLSACTSTPPAAPLTPADTLSAFSARHLDGLSTQLPPPASGWDRTQWLAAALELNPQLAEQRAAVLAAAAGERTAAEHPNPNIDLFAEYLVSAAQSGAWLYGLSLDFLLRQPGTRARATQHAALETALAESDLAESIWRVRSTLREALLDAAAAQDESVLLDSLTSERAQLLDSDRKRLALGDIARAQLLTDELELARAHQRQQQAHARLTDATARVAGAVGVPAGALNGVPLRWTDWSAIDRLNVESPELWRTDALVGRPQIVHALREYDLAELGVRSEVAKRWPQLQLTPAYAWGGGGVREDALNDIARDSAVGVSFELPVFNQHQGAIGEAVARRTAAGEHLKAVQADIFAQIDRAELAWPAARQGWQDTQRQSGFAERQRASDERALAVGAGERAGVLSSGIAVTEARLAVLAAAYSAQQAFGALEDAYHRPLTAADSQWPPAATVPHP
jgi:cobalt-zinc-cadmium efflux system outer membrane protein